MKRSEVVEIAKQKGIKSIASKNINRLLEEIKLFEKNENLPKVTNVDLSNAIDFFKSHKKLKVLFVVDDCEYKDEILTRVKYDFYIKDKKNQYLLSLCAKFDMHDIRVSSFYQSVDKVNLISEKVLYPGEEEQDDFIKVKINKTTISCDLFTIFVPKVGSMMENPSSFVLLKHFKGIKESESETLSDIDTEDIENFEMDDESGGITLGSDDDIPEFTDEDDESYKEGDDIYSEDETFSFQSETDEEEYED